MTRNDPPGNILLVGEDGSGKETIAKAFAKELRAPFQKVDSDELRVKGDASALFTNVRDRQVVFLTNAQALRKEIVTLVRGILREFKISITIGMGPAARVHVIDVKPFTLIATCPRKSECPAELLGLFSLVLNIQPYTTSELTQLTLRIAGAYGSTLEQTAAGLIATQVRSPGELDLLVPRLLHMVNKTEVSAADISHALEISGVNPIGKVGDISSLQNLSGQEFERVIFALVTRMGFRAELTAVTGDGGVDIVATLDRPIVGGRYLFQCKCYSSTNLVSAPMVRDFCGAVTADGALKGVFITTSDFTPQARDFARKTDVELINLTDLQKLLAEYEICTAT